MPKVDHVDLVVTSLDRSLPFYRGLLAPLGWRYVHEDQGEAGATIHYLFGRDGRGMIGLRERSSPADPRPYDRFDVGLHHLALPVRSRRVVDERARWLRDRDAEIEEGPREFHYTPGYYAVFFADPDGIKLELVHRPFLRTAWWALNPRTSPFR